VEDFPVLGGKLAAKDKDVAPPLPDVGAKEVVGTFLQAFAAIIKSDAYKQNSIILYDNTVV